MWVDEVMILKEQHLRSTIVPVEDRIKTGSILIQYRKTTF